MNIIKKPLLATVLTLCWTGVIFWFSLQPAAQSAGMSSGLLNRILHLWQKISGMMIPLDTVHHLFRKLAHFGEFFVLGLCAAWMIQTMGKKRRYALGYSALVAITDECIQFFTKEGRAMRITDMGIDILGASAALAAVSLIGFLYSRAKHSRSR